MLALRLIRGARPTVQLRDLLVTAASAGTGFLLLCALGHAIGHPGSPSASLLRLAWCAVPLAATTYLAVAVARVGPVTRSGLSAVGLGPARLTALSSTITALACALGSVIALLVFLHLRGDLTGRPLDGVGTDFLAVGRPLPLPAALTLLALMPVGASATVAGALRPRGRAAGPSRTGRTARGRSGLYRGTTVRETFGRYGRFGTHPQPAARLHGAGPGTGRPAGQLQTRRQTQTRQDRVRADSLEEESVRPQGAEDRRTSAVPTPPSGGGAAPSALPWALAVPAMGLGMGVCASRTGTVPGARPGELAALVLAAVSLALAGPGLTRLCGRLLQSVRPGALRLLAGRVLMTEATRIGRPLGVVCAVLSGLYAMGSPHHAGPPPAGPLTLFGVLLVTCCTVATLLTAAVEARQAHAGTRAVLLRFGASTATPRRAAVLRACALLSLFGPLTVLVTELAAMAPQAF